MDASFLSEIEVAQLGLGYVGSDVKISRLSVIISPENTFIGDRSRIDAFTILSSSGGKIDLGMNVHIASHSTIMGAGNVSFADFSGISQGVRIFSSSDDYSGNALTNPTLPKSWTEPDISDVYLGRHVIVGANSVILPGIAIGDCSAVGANSLVMRDLPGGGIFAGNPAKFIRNRETKILELETKYLESLL